VKGGDEHDVEPFFKRERQGSKRYRKSTHRGCQWLAGCVTVAAIPYWQGLKDVNMMEPVSTLLLCLPAALVLIVCGCRLAVRKQRDIGTTLLVGFRIAS
jgi:hypothetical protein